MGWFFGTGACGLAAGLMAACTSSSPVVASSDAGAEGGATDASADGASACPPSLTSSAGACSPEGLSCSYQGGLASLTCVDATWLTCGDAQGTACGASASAPVEGARCCPNEYAGPRQCCAAGRICNCVGYHVQCTDPCGDGGAAVDAASDARAD